MSWKADTHTRILSAGIGVAVRRGAPKPDIGSVDAFKRALLEAKSIAYLREGPSGVYLAGLLQRLGIADQVKAKSTVADTDSVSVMIANGEAELGVVIIPNILNVPGAELVGPLPRAAAQQPEAAMQLIQFLKSPRHREREPRLTCRWRSGRIAAMAPPSSAGVGDDPSKGETE